MCRKEANTTNAIDLLACVQTSPVSFASHKRLSNCQGKMEPKASYEACKLLAATSCEQQVYKNPIRSGEKGIIIKTVFM